MINRSESQLIARDRQNQNSRPKPAALRKPARGLSPRRKKTAS